MKNWREADTELKESAKIRSEDQQASPSNLPVPVEPNQIDQPKNLINATSKNNDLNSIRKATSSLFEEAKCFLEKHDIVPTRAQAYVGDSIAASLMLVGTFAALILLGVAAPWMRNPQHHWNAHDFHSFLKLMAICSPIMFPFSGQIIASFGDWFKQKRKFAPAGLLYAIATTMSNVYGLSSLFLAGIADKQLNFYRETGDLWKADKLVKQLIARNDNREAKSMSTLSSLAAKSAAISARLGNLHEARPIAARAQDIHEKSLRLDHSSVGSTTRLTRLLQVEIQKERSRSAEFHYNMGLFFKYSSSFEESLEEFKLALTDALHGPFNCGLTVSLVTNIGSIYLETGRLDEAEAWLALALPYCYEEYIDSATKVQIFNNLAMLSLSRDALDTAKEYLHSAEHLSMHWKNSLDRAETFDLLAKVCTGQQDWTDAELNLKQAIDIRTRTLRNDHPIVLKTLREYASVLRQLGKDYVAGDLEHDIERSESNVFSGAENEKSKIPKNLDLIQARATMPKRFYKFLVLATIIAMFPVIDNGFRAADFVSWTGLVVCTIILFCALSYKFAPSLKIKFLEKKLNNLPHVPVIISFRRLENLELTGSQIFIASLELPFSCEMLVKEEFGIIRNHLYKYSQPGKYKVIYKNNKPSAIVTPEGPIVIEPRTPELEQELQLRPIKALGLAFVIPISLLLGLPFVAMKLSDDLAKPVTLPAGLTPFEYYRMGVKLVEDSWKGVRSQRLIKAREALNQASVLDGQGIIATLAHNYSQSELPKNVPEEEVLTKYFDALRGIERCEDGAKEKLEYCVKNAPQFEWPYALLAELSIDEKDFGQAQNLLNRAKAINPQGLPYLLAQAKLEDAQGNKERAYALIKQAIEIDPFKFDSYKQLAHLIFL